MPAPEVQWPDAESVLRVIRNKRSDGYSADELVFAVNHALHLAKQAVARAFDDPSQSPVGEVRQLPAPDSRMVVKTDLRTSPWVPIASCDVPTIEPWLRDKDVVGWPVVDQLHTIPATSS
jgi:hypothetical protein